MISGVESRTGILAVFLTLQLLVFILEILVFTPSIRTRGWYMPLRQWLAPLGVALLGVILVPIVFIDVESTGEALHGKCGVGVDADVAGDGVRIAAWVQVCVLIAISLLGTFHPNATGAKEMGAGLVLTHISLAIALLVQVKQQTLTLADAAVGAMILDAQNMALSIPLAAKESLAARWQVQVTGLIQLFGLITLLFIVRQLFQGSFSTEECPCLTVFWWAWLSNCQPPQNEQALFWVYCSLRCLIFAQTSFHSLYNTQEFHEAEPKCGDEGTEIQQKGGVLVSITYPNDSIDGLPASYSEYPATTSSIYALHGVLALTSMSAAEMAIQHSNLQPSSAINSVGQIIALVVAAATALRAGWLFLMLFIRDWTSGKVSGIMWPFRLYNFTQASGWQGYTLLPTSGHDPSTIKLGSIINDPKDPFSPLDDPVTTEPAVRTRIEDVEQITTTRSRGPKRVFNHIPAFRDVTAEDLKRVTADAMETVKFTPSTDYIEESMKKPGVEAYLESMRGPANRVFMVTGVMNAEGFTLSTCSSSSTSASASMAVPGFPLDMGASAHMGRSKEMSTTYHGLIPVAYRLEAITVGKDGYVFKAQRYGGDNCMDTIA
ncbi:hypothetical protein NCS57_00536900 [Fusarium keratoplasticum]|uniref:Uncharacterized protein n=1 Tax=Fusarium keratoplasticum TaxID=1328300 RepID=A0ACC0R0X9_9HYPO|nr:hypothetical protein NCS57_00536900 [Fusarium keratoplasticum]KAI8670645.1 hypothetical protein NCS57_00536900 [Fusarium keratoplasticum]